MEVVENKGANLQGRAQGELDGQEGPKIIKDTITEFTFCRRTIEKRFNAGGAEAGWSTEEVEG